VRERERERERERKEISFHKSVLEVKISSQLKSFQNSNLKDGCDKADMLFNNTVG
jgi:hypothetical protein